MATNNNDSKNNPNANEPNQESQAPTSKTQDNVTEMKDKKPSLEDDLAQMRNDYLYLKAEFENYKRNNIKERAQLLRYGGEKIGFDLIGVLDIFEKALEGEVNENSWPSFVEGMKLTSKELKTTLEKHGIQEIEAKGKKFDPNHHEAMTQVPTDEADPETVIEVFRKGYLIHDRVLRPAQVVVAKGK